MPAPVANVCCAEANGGEVTPKRAAGSMVNDALFAKGVLAIVCGWADEVDVETDEEACMA